MNRTMQLILITGVTLLTTLSVKLLGETGPIALFALIPGLAVVIAVFKNPSMGLLLMVIAGYCAAGITRYLPLQWGLSVDGLLVLAGVAFFFRIQNHPMPKQNSPFLSKVIAVWIVYNIFEIANPEAVSRVAWFYAMRGVAFYMLIYYFVRWFQCDRKFFDRVIAIWIVFAVLGAIWGIKQKHFGLDGAEQRWLMANIDTHLLHGKLRVFSFFSDTAQYGVNQAYTAVLTLILLLEEKRFGRRVLYGIAMMLCFYGMLISGTRSASLAFPLGIGFYFVLKKNWNLVVPGLVFLVVFVGIMRYTYIGQGNYEVQRLRSAFKPTEDASFQVRLENQKTLLKWLPDHPFGGGVGSAGYWGLRFSPDTFLANLALDSWYVKIAAEQGWVGFFLYIFMMLVGLFKGMIVLGKTEDPRERTHLLGFLSVYFALLVVSYSNQYMGQIPTGVLVYIMMGRFSVEQHGGVEVSFANLLIANQAG